MDEPEWGTTRPVDVPAFAIADHQHAHVYVADSDDIDRMRVLQARPGSAAVLDGAEVLFNPGDKFA